MTKICQSFSCVVSAAVTCLCILASWNASAAETRVVNLNVDGVVPERTTVLGNDQSADGRYIVFVSSSQYTNNPLILGTNVFLRDLATGTVEQVSVSSEGMPGNSSSREPSISNDGRYVLFESDATNLIDDDTNGVRDIFLRDRQTGDTKRVSVGISGEQLSRFSRRSQLSGNGNVAVFESNAPELPGLGTQSDLYIYDVDSQSISSPAFDSSGNRRASGLAIASLSDDGNTIALLTRASLDPRHNSVNFNVYVYDRTLDSFELVSYTSDTATPAFGAGVFTEISGDGRYVAFFSASPFVPDDTDNRNDLMVRDRATGEVWVATVDAEGMHIADPPLSSKASISDDGQSIVFDGAGAAFSPLDTGTSSPDVYLFDRITNKTELISRNNEGVPADRGVSSNMSLSGNGRYTLFESGATNLDPLGEPGLTNLFRRDRGAPCGSLAEPLVTTLAPNQWFQLSIPCEPTAGSSTLEDVLADDVPGTYGETWIVFVYEQVGDIFDYRALELDEPMTLGMGFWFTHITDAPVTLDMPPGSRGPSTNLDSGAACVSVVGCYLLTLLGESMDEVRWNMVGNPFPDPQGLDVGNIRVTTGDGECATEAGCSLDAAAEAGVLDNQFFSWNGSTYDSIGAGSMLAPWTSGWLAELQSPDVLSPALHMPE